MKQQKLNAFVDIVRHYFAQFNEELVIDTPYLVENDVSPKLHDYTGVIGISGVKRGIVYVTASKELLNSVLKEFGEPDKNDDNLIDLVGEIANTIAGNARTEFGSEFHISIPLVFKGSAQSVALPKKERSFIIPIMWKSQVGEIVICLQN